MIIFSILAIYVLLCSELVRCQNPCNESSRFRCRNGICISKAKVCNGYRDCEQGEDEQDCDGIDICRLRNLSMVESNNYTCKGRCRLDGTCKAPRKSCICDDECGFSCVNPYSTCSTDLPVVENNLKSYILRMDRDTKTLKQFSSPPYYFMDIVKYVCNKGRRLKGPLPRCTAKKDWSHEKPTCVDIVCHDPVPQVLNANSHRFVKPENGRKEIISSEADPETNYTVEYNCVGELIQNGNPPRCDENQRWTEHTIKCVVPCYEDRNPDVLSRYNLQCGQECDTTLDCPSDTECQCQVGCSRICVNPNVDCGDAPDVPQTVLNYTGSGIYRIARYTCQEGYYLNSGKLSLRCSASGVWTGELPHCLPVDCGYPGNSIRSTGGQLYTYQGARYNDTVKFSCRSNYKMLGSPVRKCMGNGKWSGILTVCDLKDNEERCPHPGVPINGGLIGDDFRFGATVRFECDRGYIMFGSPVQTCLTFKEWNGTATPTCENPKYPRSASDVLNTLTRSLSNLPDMKTSIGRSIDANDFNKAHEIYFLFDVSESVLNKTEDLYNEIQFAKRFVSRMKGFRGTIYYGIMVYASSNVTALDITERQTIPDKVIEKLDEVYTYSSSKRYKSDTRSGTATGYALKLLRGQMAFMKQPGNAQKTTMRHVFIFTDGMHTEGDNPITEKRRIESEFEDEVEFYSITACSNCVVKAYEEVKGLSSGEDGENYIRINDFYDLSSYLDKVTDLKIDFTKCGQAGEVGSIKKQATPDGDTGAKVAAQNAWPWQAVIARTSGSMKQSLSKNFLGGASILNENWLLTAAHVLENLPTPTEDNVFLKHYVVYVGICERPDEPNFVPVQKSVEAYSLGSYSAHPQFNKSTFVNDIALIKLGNELDENLNVKNEKTGGLTFGYYIRPVCLPCTRTCLQEKHLVGDDGVLLINDDIDSIAECRVEENFLHSHRGMTVVTGFGNVGTSNSSGYTINPEKNLQQALLKIQDIETCQQGITDINIRLKGEDQNSTLMEYADSMICCKSGSPGVIRDACRGDSGGPMVKEVKDEQTQKSCWVQIGIVSFGFGCGVGYPGYYTNVARYIPWINETMSGILPGL